MMARLLLLPDAARRAIALACVVFAVALTVFAAAVLTLSLLERQAARSQVMAETARLHAALQQRLDARGPQGPSPASDAQEAEAALIETAGAVADALAGGPVDVAFGAPQTARLGGVDEVRLEVALTGPPDDLAAALARIDTGPARVFLFTLAAAGDAGVEASDELAEARIVFALTVREAAP